MREEMDGRDDGPMRPLQFLGILMIAFLAFLVVYCYRHGTFISIGW